MKKYIHIRIKPQIIEIRRIQEALRIALGIASAGHRVLLSLEPEAEKLLKSSMEEELEECLKYTDSLKKYEAEFSQQWSFFSGNDHIISPQPGEKFDFTIKM